LRGKSENVKHPLQVPESQVTPAFVQFVNAKDVVKAPLAKALNLANGARGVTSGVSTSAAGDGTSMPRTFCCAAATRANPVNVQTKARKLRIPVNDSFRMITLLRCDDRWSKLNATKKTSTFRVCSQPCKGWLAP
jgi:hypothetical protein